MESAPENERDWYSNLEMLSVERTERFISELGLPFQRKEFSDLRRFARACLEVYIAPSRGMKAGPFEAPEFPKYWQRYREKEGVLSEDLLLHYADLYKERKDVLFAMASDLRGWIGTDKTKLLEDWVAKDFRPMNSGYQIWLHAFWEVLKASSDGTAYVIPPPTKDTQLQAVQLFCDDFYSRKKALAEQFREIVGAAKQDGPSLWEAALQTFPVDSRVGGSYPWLNTVRKCLELRLFRDCWRDLRNQLGQEDMDQLVEWVVKSSNQPELPDERRWFFG